MKHALAQILRCRTFTSTADAPGCKHVAVRWFALLHRLGQCALAAALLASLGPSRVLATDGMWTRTTAGGLWSSTANWSGGIIADGADGVADFSTLDIVFDDRVRLDSPRTIGTLKFGDTSPSNNWFVDNNSSTSNVLTLGSSTVPLIQVNNKTATINTVLAGAQGFTETGNGSLVLTAANSLTGHVTISSGILQIANGNALQNSTVALNVNNALTFASGIGPVTIGGLSGSGGFSLSNTSQF